MKRNIFLLFIVLFCCLSFFSQNKDNERNIYTARAINYSFWKQLDSIRNNVYKDSVFNYGIKKTFKYYRIYVSNAHDSEILNLEYTPLQTDSVFNLVLQGCNRPCNINYYKTIFGGTIYYIYKGANNIFVKKGDLIRIRTSKYISYEDLIAPCLLLTYQNGILRIIKDTRNTD